MISNQAIVAGDAVKETVIPYSLTFVFTKYYLYFVVKEFLVDKTEINAFAKTLLFRTFSSIDDK
jgi:hypothetical protein